MVVCYNEQFYFAAEKNYGKLEIYLQSSGTHGIERNLSLGQLKKEKYVRMKTWSDHCSYFLLRYKLP